MITASTLPTRWYYLPAIQAAQTKSNNRATLSEPLKKSSWHIN
ncbi:uncharacterized protein METZ01_LOCUS245674 [marine metagenome]|uniref:Uncharacterized protein n=1 Tax=marine metagenome TaxID=408172 RepID=A0A382HZK9_9ZZZZ